MADVQLHGLIAQFPTGDALVVAAEKAHSVGYRRMDAYSPYPVHGLSEAIGFKKTVLPWLIFGGGVTGALGGFFMQWYSAKYCYALNVGGKPFNSWPAFIPITFECTILLSAFTAVFGMLGLNGLPRPHHPLFNLEAFSQASRDKFFLCIESVDPKFKLDETRAFLVALHPEAVDEVPAG